MFCTELVWLIHGVCVDSLWALAQEKWMLFYIRGVISKAFEVMTTYYKSVSIDFSIEWVEVKVE